jgi:hypothetical protein
MDGDDRIEARPVSAPNQQLLVVELLAVRRYCGPVGVNTAPLLAPGGAVPDPLEIVVSPETVVVGVGVDPVAPGLPDAGVLDPVVVEPAEPEEAPAPVSAAPVPVPVTPVPVTVVGVVVDVGTKLVGVPPAVPGEEPVPVVVVAPGVPIVVLEEPVVPVATSGP